MSNEKSVQTLRTTHVLSAVILGCVSGHKKVKEVGDAIVEKYGVRDSSRISGNVNVYRTSELEDVHKHMAKVRNEHAAQTLPFGLQGGSQSKVSGNYKLHANTNTSAFDEYFEKERVISFNLLERAHESIREQEIRDRYELGSLPVDGLYPSWDEMRARYTFNLDWQGIPSVDDPRIGCSPEQVERIRNSQIKQQEERLKCANTAVLQRLRDTLEGLVNLGEYNGGKKGSFNDSRINNAVKLASLLEGFNLYGDPEIDSIRKSIIRDFSGLDPKDLRKLDDEGQALRDDTVTKAKSLLDRIPSFRPD
jgi:hypothetical protein